MRGCADSQTRTSPLRDLDRQREGAPSRAAGQRGYPAELAVPIACAWTVPDSSAIAETGVTQLDNAFAGYPLKVREQVLGVAAAFSCQPLTEAALQAFESVVHSIAQFRGTQAGAGIPA